MSKKVADAFANGKAFIPFITCGDPSLEVTEQLVYACEEAGADVFLRCSNRCNSIIFHQKIQNIGRQKRRKRRTKADVFNTQVQKR